mmetsp:Transcript_9020/g.12837  ORF Transcript_9020/g.12837 Transcript_9020/m.12837 type:complete len:428 (+) Transcript_9020:160-1443(+)
MKLSLATAALACLASQANAFTTGPTKFGGVGINSRSVNARNLLHQVSTSSNDSSSAKTTEDSNNDGDDTTATLTPEYQAAFGKTIATLEAAIDNDQLLQPLKYFTTEYFTCNQNAFLASEGKDETASPVQAAERILNAIQFGMKYGLGPNKFTFSPSHKALRGEGTCDEDTEDFYAFGCDFFRPCMDLKNSIVHGQDNLQKAFDQIKAGENVVFFANHQSEADPQVFSVMLEQTGFTEEAANVVYVAGHKVTTDALAIPFSMGRNLLCIHSKKHIDADPETKGVKNRQNLSTMSAMLSQLRRGGTALWVAPSGGRDRRNLDTGKVPIAPFDSKTIDMFRLMGNKSKVPTHYYPLAMVSYELCPPPDFVEAGVGEQRNIRFSPVAISCGAELESVGGLEKRHEFCENAEKVTDDLYQALTKEIGIYQD